MWLPLIGLALGVFLGLKTAIEVPAGYANYTAIAVLAGLDTVFGGIRAGLEDHFDNLVYVTGFFSNALLAAGLAFVGDRLGVNMYSAALFAFGFRIFQNLGIIRHHLLDRWRGHP